MNTRTDLTGSCLCKAVGIAVRDVTPHVEACHCSMCRTWGGGPLLAVQCADNVTLQGESNVAVYDSSDWAQRGFCSRCGTHLFYRLKEPAHYAIPAGLFDQPVDWSLEAQIFIDEKPAYYEFANDTRKLTSEEVFAQFADGDQEPAT